MNAYTAKDLRTVINWLRHDKLVPFLEENGIHPVQEFTTAKRHYRLYDESALTKCHALKATRDQAILVQGSAPSEDIFNALRQMREELCEVRRQMDFIHKELIGQTAIFDDEGSGGTD